MVKNMGSVLVNTDTYLIYPATGNQSSPSATQALPPSEAEMPFPQTVSLVNSYSSNKFQESSPF